VPGEVWVIGYDDSRLARLTHINLTTVAQDPEQMARLAVEAVGERLKGEPGMPPRDILLDPRLVVRGTTGPDVDGAHEPADSCSALAGVLGRLLACSPALSRLAAVCPGVLPRWWGPDVGGSAQGADDAGFALQLVTVRRLGMFPEDPLAGPGSRSWPAAASPGYRPVWLGSWAGRWLPASR
jgi:hypothetical protein